MTTLFETLKLIFLVATLLLAFIVFQANRFLAAESVSYLHTLTMPGYLVLCGILLGYISYLLRTASPLLEEDERNRIGVQSFIVGIMIGILFALIHIFVL